MKLYLELLSILLCISSPTSAKKLDFGIENVGRKRLILAQHQWFKAIDRHQCKISPPKSAGCVRKEPSDITPLHCYADLNVSKYKELPQRKSPKNQLGSKCNIAAYLQRFINKRETSCSERAQPRALLEEE